MIIYSATKSSFFNDVLSNRIEDRILEVFQRRTGHTTGKSEIASWKNSLQYMKNALELAGTPDDAGVSIEYTLPQTSKRIDFILTGKDSSKRDTAIIVELKQWTDVQLTSKNATVTSFVGGSNRELLHPSYQAWSYAALLEDFNETVRDEFIQLKPCAYLHNCKSDDVVNHTFYEEYTDKAPSFLKDDAQRLAEFISKHVVFGDKDRIMYRIEHGRIKPSKNLADSLASMLKGNREFIMVDEQKLVYETVLELAEKAQDGQKQVLIVEGGPGTGKSVVAINLLVELTNNDLVVQYVSKNSAPRDVYASKLSGTMKKTRISNLFKGSGSYHSCERNAFDVLLVDEAHRLNEKSGMFQNIGENQIKEIINSASHSVFFLDEDQRIHFKDIGEKQAIIGWAEQLGAKVTVKKLSSQFRCNGSDGYLSWLDDVLQVRETANQNLDNLDYEFVVVDNPNELREIIIRKNRINNKARMVAGYCWDWVSKKEKNADDIVIDDYNFSMKWNLANDGNLWILKEESVDQIGCIHTCQGLELDYIGVIIGPDMIVRNGEVIAVPEQRAKTDSSIKGYKKLVKTKPEKAKVKADLIIKNTYRTLMTRGQKGCYIFCTDPETNQYFKERLNIEVQNSTESAFDFGEEPTTTASKYDGLTLEILPAEEVDPYVNAVPIYDLQIAAGGFSEFQNVHDYEWVKLPEFMTPHKDLFVAQVVGESMNKRIPNGSWCLFKKNPGGSRNGRIVLVQHRDLCDEDTGGEFTIKRYHSEKIYNEDGEWMHTRIVLKPETTALGYDEIVITESEEGALKVIAEFVAVL